MITQQTLSSLWDGSLERGANNPTKNRQLSPPSDMVRAPTIHSVVEQLMHEHEEYREKPLCYEKQNSLCHRVEARLGHKVKYTSVSRARRKVSATIKKERW